MYNIVTCSRLQITFGIEKKIGTKVCYLPTNTISSGEALGLSNLYTSMVNTVEAELKMDVNDDINAANMTANIKPRKTKK